MKDGNNQPGTEPVSPAGQPLTSAEDAWEKLRGSCKDIFAEYGGGEAYLRAERASFDSPESARVMGEPLPSGPTKKDA